MMGRAHSLNFLGVAITVLWGFAGSGCFPKLLPVSALHDDGLDVAGPSGADVGVAPVGMPLPLLHGFGLRFDEEVLTIFGHERWAMHEICRVDRPGAEPLWFTLDSEIGGDQFVGVATEEAWEIAKPLGAPLYRNNMTVERVREGKEDRWIARYTLPDQEQVELTFVFKGEPSVPGKRNGNGMNHSERRLAAVLDLELAQLGKASGTIDGEPVKIWNVVPGLQFTSYLVQTVGGFDSAYLRFDPTDAASDFVWTDNGDTGAIYQDRGLIAQRWVYHKTESGHWELMHTQVEQRGDVLWTATFSPWLPDTRGGLNEPWTGRFSLAVGSLAVAGRGAVTIVPHDQGISVSLDGDAPLWVRERRVISCWQPDPAGPWNWTQRVDPTGALGACPPPYQAPSTLLE